MKTFLITYDLSGPGRNYSALIEAIKRISGTWARPVQSTWIVVGNITPIKIRETLKEYLDGNDKLLVLEVSATNWAALNTAPDVSDWLRRQVAA